jgi:dTDP-glucose 4,6-dehydratase
VAGDGSQTRSVCYVDDLIEGIVRVLHSELSGPINLGNPHELSVLALAELIREFTFSSSDIRFIPRPTDDPSIRQPDITLAVTHLDWKPSIPVRDGLQRTIAWFRRHPEMLLNRDQLNTRPAKSRSEASILKALNPL